MRKDQIDYKMELLNLTENEKVISVSSKTGETYRIKILRNYNKSKSI